MLKYSRYNIDRYIGHLLWLKKQNLVNYKKLFFFDEMHVVSKSVAKQRGLLQKGTTLVVPNSQLDHEAFSISCLMGLSSIRFEIRSFGANTALDYFRFLTQSLTDGSLPFYSTVILDNASIHHTTDNVSSIFYDQVASVSFTKFHFIPTYAPEFNGIELLFAQIKRYLRDKRNYQKTLKQNIIDAFNVVTPKNVENYFNHCLKLNVVLDIKNK